MGPRRNSGEVVEQQPIDLSAMSSIVRDTLGPRLDYDDPQGELAKIEALLDELDTQIVPVEATLRVASEQATEISQNARDKQLIIHRAELELGHVLVLDETGQLEDDECGWLTLEPNQNPYEFSKVINDQAAAPISATVEVEDIASALKEFVAIELPSLALGLHDYIPKPIFNHGEVGLRGLMRTLGFVFGKMKLDDISFLVEDEDVQAEKDIRLARKARKLRGILESAREDPANFLTELYIERGSNDIMLDAFDAVDLAIATENTGIAARQRSQPQVSHRQRSQRNRRAARIEIEQEPAVAIEEPAVEQDEVQPSEPEQATSERAETPKPLEGYQEIDEAKFNFPWISAEKTSSILALVRSAGGNEIYMTRALIPKFKKISDKVRRNSARNEEGLTRYDQHARQHAERMADGVLPHQTRNSVKQVKNLSPNFGVAPVWFTHDVSPNTPRVHYTVKKLRELVDPEDVDQTTIDLDKLCMVILAETDKAHEEDIMQVLTGRSRSYLRQNKVGSI